MPQSGLMSKAKLLQSLKKNNDLLKKFSLMSRSRTSQLTCPAEPMSDFSKRLTMNSRTSSRTSQRNTQPLKQVIMIQKGGLIPRLPQKSMIKNIRLFSGMLKRLVRNSDETEKKARFVDQVFYHSTGRKSIKYEFQH